MKLTTLLFFIMVVTPLYSNHAWLDSVSHRIDPDAVLWSKELLKKAIISENQHQDIQKFANASLQDLSKKQCHLSLPTKELEPHIYCFLSFSVPESTWVSLLQELETVGGVIVLRGLPNNSFQSLSENLQKMIDQGVNVPIQIHPHLFDDFSVESVPAFVVTEGEKFDKVTGNVSLAYAIRLMNEKGKIKESLCREAQ